MLQGTDLTASFREMTEARVGADGKDNDGGADGTEKDDGVPFSNTQPE